MNKRKTASQSQKMAQPDLFGEPAPSLAATRQTREEKPKANSTRLSGATAHSTSVLLNVRQAAVRLGLSKSTLDKMRTAGKGPRFVKTTERAIRYDPVDLDRWINARRSRSD